ncbi:MAG: class I SAM-dependent methyltransferase [Gammaproteobacteria bacterium]|nr:class I SAM-dependent methyltransferase [Gammaproteobacteria bacterium]MCW9054988.1 class I SAM-dependent methyltransferase [Gammaproteobacteria bacterium]
MNNYEPLRKKLNFAEDLPFTPDWSAAADFLTLIADHCLEKKPATIVECSSGLSTLILARCCQLNEHGKVYSLENGSEYAEKTRQQINDFDLKKYATVIDAPLEKKEIEDSDYLWYSIKSMPVNSIDMLVIDGPPGFIQPNSRYPALPVLNDRLSNNCKIFMDDASRDDEKNIIQLWLDRFPQLKHEYIDTERGCSILSINK